METVTLQTESYLFQNSDGQFRAVPFYELSINEWVVFENGQPKYFLDFNRRTKPLVQDLTKRLNNGEEIDEAVEKLGRFLGRQWTTNQKIEGSEIPYSQQTETFTVTYLDNLADLFMDVYFVATNTIDPTILLDEDKFIKAYVTDTDEQLFETVYAANQNDLILMLTFIFNQTISLTEIISNNDRQVYDLSNFKQTCISVDQFEIKYEQWIEVSKRENSMNEYGMIMGAIAFINNNLDKKYLSLITERRKHW